MNDTLRTRVRLPARPQSEYRPVVGHESGGLVVGGSIPPTPTRRHGRLSLAVTTVAGSDRKGLAASPPANLLQQENRHQWKLQPLWSGARLERGARRKAQCSTHSTSATEGTAHGERPALNTGFVSKEDSSILLPSATGRRRRGGASPASNTGGSKEQWFDSTVFRNWRANRTGCGLGC